MEVGMATRVTVALEDDLDGGPADETLWFGLGGWEYEIDLNEKNARTFHQQLAPFLEHARKAGRGPRRRPVRASSSHERSGAVWVSRLLPRPFRAWWLRPARSAAKALRSTGSRSWPAASSTRRTLARS